MPEKKNTFKFNKEKQGAWMLEHNILKSANKMCVSVTCIACKLKSDEAGHRFLSLCHT